MTSTMIRVLARAVRAYDEAREASENNYLGRGSEGRAHYEQQCTARRVNPSGEPSQAMLTRHAEAERVSRKEGDRLREEEDAAARWVAVLMAS